MINNEFPLLNKYLSGNTYAEIGKELGITRERVRQKIEREKSLFFRKNIYLKQRIRNTLSRNGFFYSFRRNNKLLRLLKLLAKEENFNTFTVSAKKRIAYVIMPSHKNIEDIKHLLNMIKEEITLPAEIEKIYTLLNGKGISSVEISFFIKLFDAKIEDGEVIKFQGLPLKENLKMYFRSNSEFTLEELSRIFSVSQTTVRKTLKELGILKVKRRERGLNRTKLIAVNVTEEEYRKIKRTAEEMGYSISTLVRGKLKELGLI